MWYTFKSDDWETIETFWCTPWLAPTRRLYVSPAYLLWLKVAFFVVKQSDNGYIDYGGFSGVGYQQVQARRRRGESITITQTVPVSA